MLKVCFAFLLSTVSGFLLFNNSIKPILAQDQVQNEISLSSPSTIATSTPSPTPAPTASPTPTSTPKPKVIPTPKETLLLTPTPSPIPTFTHAQINELIQNISPQFGVDPNVMRHLALCESEFNPLAKNGPYWGLYQYGPITWQNLRVTMKKDSNTNLRLNADEAIVTTAYALSLGKRGMWPNCQP